MLVVVNGIIRVQLETDQVISRAKAAAPSLVAGVLSSLLLISTTIPAPRPFIRKHNRSPLNALHCLANTTGVSRRQCLGVNGMHYRASRAWSYDVSNRFLTVLSVTVEQLQNSISAAEQYDAVHADVEYGRSSHTRYATGILRTGLLEATIP
ncbi:hypothetical protein AVEN_203839-1 [Araneus ventricosus]|uniref:Uncharacterized protein n=1 Tax=Araneus ventricosus TaxID=182803 RepID=A0A4Y2TVJ3_ARAVE|nr:hypothetical protein AVEN_203839-1 [Araneus ventricosus]